MSITSFSRILLLLLFLFASHIHLYAHWNHFIINYEKSLYGNGSQTWQINSYDGNRIYFANQNGMLQYDGNEWSRFRMNNFSDVRSVYPSLVQERIYAGGINEFGYFEPDERGRLEYTCLSDSIRDAERFIGNIWGIHEADNIMYMLGDSRIAKYLNGKFTIINMGRKIDCSNIVNGVLYVGTDNGVFLLVGNTFFPLQGGEIFNNKRIRGIIPHQDGIMVVTAYDGLFYNDGKTTVLFETGIEAFLKENEVFCVASSDHQIALGTVHNGVVLIDRTTLAVKYFNENNGLQNNTVLSVAFDAHENLWAGLDSGIDYVCLNSPLSHLYVYPYSFGTGYDAVLHGNYLYLATNRGLYYTTYPIEMNGDRPDIQAVWHSSGQVWSLTKIGDELFCLHDRGMFVVNGTALKKIAGINGVWNCQLVEGETDRMFVGGYDGIYLLDKSDDGEWKLAWKIDGVTDSYRFFEQESPQTLWMRNQGKVARVELDINLTNVERETEFNSDDGLPNDMDIYISKIDKKLYFSTSQGIYSYNSHSGRMELSSEMNNLLNAKGPYYKILKFNDHIIGLNRREICISNTVAYKMGADAYVLSIDIPSVELVQGAETIVPLSDSLMVIPNDNGFALAAVPNHKSHKDHDKIVRVRNVFISYPQDSLIYSDNFRRKKYIPDIPFSHNSLRFEFGVPIFAYGEDVNFQYRLDKDEWSDFTKSTLKEYSNLSEGVHVFEVKALFADAVSATDKFEFRILPPWYRTNIAYVCYASVFLIFLWLAYRWDKTRVKREKQRAIIEKDKEMQQREREFEKESERKEKQIMQLEKETLEHNLQYKNQEMANLMINFIRKNEMLTEIKTDIIKAVSALKADNTKDVKQMLLIVNNKIDSNIQADDVLKRIEEQFDLVHNNFMTRLQEKHPDLSQNEKIMCAYLKMNLSTKEIAPLLNISIRGVETIRFRIRKKFSLERDHNLIDYLNKQI